LVEEKKNGINYSIANFGKIPYGGQFLAPIIMASPPNACSPLKELNITDPSTRPIILAERGQCAFVTKVRNVEKAGGKMAIIVKFDCIYVLGR